MTREEAREVLIDSMWKAEGHIDAIRDMDEVTLLGLEEHLSGYALGHFLLDEDEAANHTLEELASMSVAKSNDMPSDVVAEVDDAKGFTGGATPEIREASLFASIESKLGVRLDEERAKKVHRLPQLAALVWRAMEASTAWSSRLARIPSDFMCPYTASLRVLAR